MSVNVVVATRGRAAETALLVRALGRGTLQPARVVVVGSDAADVAGIEPGHRVEIVLSPLGSSRQRNAGLALLRAAPDWSPRDVVAFFDDDFRPAADWLAQAERALASHPDIAGVTGEVIRDGAPGAAVTEAEAAALIAEWERAGERPETLADVHGLYGCNMALRADVLERCAFDERLPLYGWLEDLDMSGQARRFGRIVRTSRCGGVHLGVKSGRTSGVRYGYSQIANPVYLTRKGTCPAGRAAFMVARALGSNLLRAPGDHPLFDYRGRLRGNWRALLDLARGRVTPEAIVDF